MKIYLGRLTLHESLFFATREIGRLYETGRYLHNYALTYALGLVTAPYYCATQRPLYKEHLEPLNHGDIYVTPARALKLAYALATFKYACNNYHIASEKPKLNTPTFGRAKEIDVGSEFLFAVLSKRELPALPVWVRLGLWQSKAHISWQAGEAQRVSGASGEASLPLNPLDLTVNAFAFDLISMPPSSLIDHAHLHTDWWEWEMDGLTYRLPAGMQYTIPV